MNIVLCGLPGCGKTTCGKLLANQLSWEFMDTDLFIESTFSSTCRDIFLKQGEQHFRKLEKKIIQNLPRDTSKVIAVGGGALLDCDNILHLKSIGTIVYFCGSWESLYSRATANGIPAYLDEKNPLQAYKRLSCERGPLYKKAADYTINIDNKTIQQVALELYNLGKNIGK